MARFLKNNLSETDINTPFMLLFQLGYKLYAVYEQSFKEIPADISLITDKLPMDKFHKSLVFKRLTIVHITGSEHKIQEFSAFVACQMKLESEKLAYGTLASLCYFLERLMDMDSLVPTYPQRSTVNEADACTLAQKYLLDEQGQWNGYFLFQFNKTVMGNDLGKEMSHMPTDLFHIEMLQTTESRVMEKYHEEHNFSL